MAKDLVRTRRYVQKFYQMRTQLQAVGLRIQTLRSNQQMAEAMRGATRVCPRLSLISQGRLIFGIGNVRHEQRDEPASDLKDPHGV
jgi:charged multivesicular body protein 2A